MTAVDRIKVILESDLLNAGLVHIPHGGANNSDIRDAERSLPRRLSKMHRNFLFQWDGIDLEVLRIYGIKPSCKGVKHLLESQKYVVAEDMIAFGDDPSGIVYMESADGVIYSLDTKTSELNKAGDDFNKFIENNIFGNEAEAFMGKWWMEQMISKGLIS